MERKRDIIVILLVNTEVQLTTSVIFIVKKPLLLPVIFHNLSGYHSHLFIKQLSTKKGEVIGIPSTDERYKDYSDNQWNFLAEKEFIHLILFKILNHQFSKKNFHLTRNLIQN